jgi:hypothetical protein
VAKLWERMALCPEMLKAEKKNHVSFRHFARHLKALYMPGHIANYKYCFRKEISEVTANALFSFTSKKSYNNAS